MADMKFKRPADVEKVLKTIDAYAKVVYEEFKQLIEASSPCCKELYASRIYDAYCEIKDLYREYYDGIYDAVPLYLRKYYYHLINVLEEVQWMAEDIVANRADMDAAEELLEDLKFLLS